jgi:hypothetical protein
MRKEGRKEKKEGKLSQKKRQKGRDKKKVCCLGTGREKKQRLLRGMQRENHEKEEDQTKKREERRLPREGWKEAVKRKETYMMGGKKHIYEGRKEETKTTWGIGGGMKRIN